MHVSKGEVRATDVKTSNAERQATLRQRPISSVVRGLATNHHHHHHHPPKPASQHRFILGAASRHHPQTRHPHPTCPFSRHVGDAAEIKGLTYYVAT